MVLEFINKNRHNIEGKVEECSVTTGVECAFNWCRTRSAVGKRLGIWKDVEIYGCRYKEESNEMWQVRLSGEGGGGRGVE